MRERTLRTTEKGRSTLPGKSGHSSERLQTSNNGLSSESSSSTITYSLRLSSPANLHPVFVRVKEKTTTSLPPLSGQAIENVLGFAASFSGSFLAKHCAA